jgi:hypothetical protein
MQDEPPIPKNSCGTAHCHTCPTFAERGLEGVTAKDRCGTAHCHTCPTCPTFFARARDLRDIDA